MDRVEPSIFQSVAQINREAVAKSRPFDARKVFPGILNAKKLFFTSLTFFISRAVFAGIAPFGVAYFATTFEPSAYSALSMVLLVFGAYSINALPLKYFLASVMCACFGYYFKKIFESNVMYRAGGAAVAIALSNAVLMRQGTHFNQDATTLLVESFLTFLAVILLDKIAPFIKSTIARKRFNEAEIISMTLLGILTLLGVSNSFTTVWGINLKNVACMYAIIMMALVSGVGLTSSFGIIVGAVISAPSANPFVLVGAYGFCALFTSLFKKFGKVGVCLAFLLSSGALTLATASSTQWTAGIMLEAALAVSAVVFTPRFIPKKVADFLKTSSPVSAHDDKVQKIITKKLNGVADAFENLADSLSTKSALRNTTGINEVTEIIDASAERICKKCSLCFSCWNNEFHSTYQVMFKLLEKLEEKGSLSPSDVTAHFAKRCMKVNELITAINSMYEMYRTNSMWQNKIEESRELVSNQLKSASSAMDKLSNDISGNMYIDDEAARLLIEELDKVGIEAQNVLVVCGEDDRCEVELDLIPCQNNDMCRSTIPLILYNVIGKEMAHIDGKCGSQICRLKFVESDKYQISIGTASVAKDNGRISGDSYVHTKLNNGKYMIALCDGMGSGESASRESSEVVKLLEHFLKMGFSKETAVLMINSALVLQSNRENFSTIDLSIVDLKSRYVEFVKVGAEATFVKHKNSVENISSSGIPAGILGKVDVEMSVDRMSHGDFLVMASDGVLDCCDDQTWAEVFLHNWSGDDPKALAYDMMSTAMDYKSNKINDDMTIIVAKLVKSRSMAA